MFRVDIEINGVPPIVNRVLSEAINASIDSNICSHTGLPPADYQFIKKNLSYVDYSHPKTKALMKSGVDCGLFCLSGMPPADCVAIRKSFTNTNFFDAMKFIAQSANKFLDNSKKIIGHPSVIAYTKEGVKSVTGMAVCNSGLPPADYLFTQKAVGKSFSYLVNGKQYLLKEKLPSGLFNLINKLAN